MQKHKEEAYKIIITSKAKNIFNWDFRLFLARFECRHWLKLENLLMTIVDSFNNA